MPKKRVLVTLDEKILDMIDSYVESGSFASRTTFVNQLLQAFIADVERNENAEASMCLVTFVKKMVE